MRGRSFAWAVLALVLGTVGAAHAQNQVVGEIPATPVVDEGFAFYTVEHQSLSGSEPPASEWWLKADFRVVGNVPPRSVLYYILKKGSQSLGEVRCDTRSTYSTVGRPTNFPTSSCRPARDAISASARRANSRSSGICSTATPTRTARS